MVKRYCPKCNAEFDRKSNYNYHINRKYECVQIINTSNDENPLLCKNIHNSCKNIHNDNLVQEKYEKIENTRIENNILVDNNKIEDNLSCSFCNKKLSSKSALTRHIKNNCKVKKEKENEKETIFKLLLEKDKQHKEEIKLHKEEVNELKKQNKLLLDKIDKLISMKENTKLNKSISSKNISNSNNHLSNSNNTINTINNTNTTNNTNTQNNFVMVNFGKEDLSIIDERLFIDRIIKKPMISGVKIPDEVLKIIHFNPTYPQLSNIYISDINRDKCMVWEDGEWKLSSVDNIPQIMDKICLFSNDQIEMLKNKYPNNKPLQDRLSIIKKYNNMIDGDYLDELKDDIDNNKNEIKRCEDFQKNTQNTLKKTLYNEGKKLKKIVNKN